MSRNILEDTVGGHFLPEKVTRFPSGKGWIICEDAEMTHFPAEKGWVMSAQSTSLTAHNNYHKEVYIS